MGSVFVLEGDAATTSPETFTFINAKTIDISASSANGVQNRTQSAMVRIAYFRAQSSDILIIFNVDNWPESIKYAGV
jgi:hypothetical protein